MKMLHPVSPHRTIWTYFSLLMKLAWSQLKVWAFFCVRYL